MRIRWLTSLRDCRPLHVVERLPGDQGHVLPDRASAGDTQDLHSPAYGKDRLAGFQDTFHEADLEQIYGNVSLAVPFLRFFAEQERRDVIAAAEEKSVAQVRCIRRAGGRSLRAEVRAGCLLRSARTEYMD